jgi:hypothetical protein
MTNDEQTSPTEDRPLSSDSTADGPGRSAPESPSAEATEEATDDAIADALEDSYDL